MTGEKRDQYDGAEMNKITSTAFRRKIDKVGSLRRFGCVAARAAALQRRMPAPALHSARG